MMSLMRDIRAAMDNDTFPLLKKRWLQTQP